MPDLTLPPSLLALLAWFEPLFTASSFRTFCALAVGFLAQTGRRTVCGMLAGAGLGGVWRHDRAHRFFSQAAWESHARGLALARLVVRLVVPVGEPVTVAIDDTLFRRRGPKQPSPPRTTPSTSCDARESQKQPSTRHNARTASDNRRSARFGLISLPS